MSTQSTGASSLRRPGAIVLISCYELGHQPLGIAQPLGYLEQAGYLPVGLDIAIEAFDVGKIDGAKFIGISVPMHTALRLGVQVGELIRTAHPSCHICFYGLYASINAAFLLESVADSVIGGEYEMPLVKLVTALEQEGENSVRNEARPLIEGVSMRGGLVEPVLKRPPSDGPVPSRMALPGLDRYARLEHDGTTQLAGYVEASRGCLHKCLHCPIVPVYEGRFFIVPERLILEDIRRQVLAGAGHITFGDPDFLNGPGHSLSIVRAMHREFPHLTFDCTTKIEHILKHRELFPEFGSAGCLFVVSAVESFSNHVLDQLVKGHSRADVLEALDIIRRAGITLRPSLVPFTPWTTLDDYIEMFDIVESLDLIESIDPVQFAIRLLIPPGSALLNKAGKGSAPISEFVGQLDQASFQYSWRHPDPRMDDLHREVTAAVEGAARTGQESRDTFEILRGLAYRAAGRPLPSVNRGEGEEREGGHVTPPRLTEAWYCCAEPMKGQLRVLQTKGRGEV